MLRTIFCCLLLGTSVLLSAQTWSIHLNGNETYILGTDLKTHHPILWWSSAENQDLVVGGFGLGASYTKPWGDNKSWRIQLNAQRSRYYDYPALFNDFNGQPVGFSIGINTNIT